MTKQELGPNQLAWIEALESGEYTQGLGSLQGADRYCCLGVACRVAEKHGIPVKLNYESRLAGSILELQKRVVEFLALKSRAGTIGEYIGEYSREASPELRKKIVDFIRKNLKVSNSLIGTVSLARLNDGVLTHPEIAVVLREFPEAYFTEPR